VFDFIRNRMVARDERVKMFEVSPLMSAFLKLVIKNGREEELPLMLKEYERLFNEKNRIAKGSVVSRTELSPSQKEKLSENLEKKFDKKIELEYSINATLLGGIYVRLDDKILDGTVTGRLKEMSLRLLEA
jgi:F-type H+-transporting ATPase subunit delta